MAEGEVVLNSLYVYAPNKGAPIFFIIAFAISAVGHIWQCSRYKAWKIIGLHPLVAVLYTAGYALREYGAYNYIYTDDRSTLMTYIMSQVFINICPPLLELSNYHTLGRIFSYVPHLAPIAPRNVLAVFGSLMGLVEALNALGVAFTSNPTGTNQGLGKIIILVALGIQLCVIAVFLVVGVLFYIRLARVSIRGRNLPGLLVTLYVSMAFILVRCVYRIVEHAGNTALDVHDLSALQGLDPLLRYEWFFYVFDGALMLGNSWLWNLVHPGRYLPENSRVRLAEDGVTEVCEVKEGEVGVRDTVRLVLGVVTLGAFGAVVPREKKEEDVESRAESE